jgi:hypothetical protein
MRYAKIALGVGLFVVCVIVGAFIPIGSGSAVLIGGVVGLLLCYLILSQKRFWSTASGAREDGGEINQKAIQEKTPGVWEAHIADSIINEQLKHPHS